MYGVHVFFDFGYIGGNSFTTYSRVPFYFTSHTRALHIDSLERAIVHFTKVDTIEIEINSTELCGRIIAGIIELKCSICIILTMDASTRVLLCII